MENSRKRWNNKLSGEEWRTFNYEMYGTSVKFVYAYM
jgi:hypothetical protein